MNLVVSVGRFTKDPELFQDGKQARAKFSLGLDRNVPRSSKNQQTADFPSYIAWGKTAETICKYFKKGNKIGIKGHIVTGSYISKAGQRVYTQDVCVDSFEFVDSPKRRSETAPEPADAGDFLNIEDEIDEEVPFE